jgi:hypothetical protein
MRKWLDAGAAVTALVAAVFWFLSAYGELPGMIPHWDQTPQNDPFYVAVKFSAKMNRWAAGVSGLSALCMALSLFLGRGRDVPGVSTRGKHN